MSERGITACFLEMKFIGLRCFDFLFAQDLSNQIRHWDVYTKAVREAGKEPGQFLNPLAAEWFSGSPSML